MYDYGAGHAEAIFGNQRLHAKRATRPALTDMAVAGVNPRQILARDLVPARTASASTNDRHSPVSSFSSAVRSP